MMILTCPTVFILVVQCLLAQVAPTAALSEFASPLLVSPLKSSAMTIITRKKLVYQLPSSAVDLKHDRLSIHQVEGVPVSEKWSVSKRSSTKTSQIGDFSSAISVTDNSTDNTKQYIYFVNKNGIFKLDVNSTTKYKLIPNSDSFNKKVIVSTIAEPLSCYVVVVNKSDDTQVELQQYRFISPDSVKSNGTVHKWTICQDDKHGLVKSTKSCHHVSFDVSSITAGFRDKNGKFYLFSNDTVYTFGLNFGFKTKSLHQFFSGRKDDLVQIVTLSPGNNSKTNRNTSKESESFRIENFSFTNKVHLIIGGLLALIGIILLVLLGICICHYAKGSLPEGKQSNSKKSTEKTDVKTAIKTKQSAGSLANAPKKGASTGQQTNPSLDVLKAKKTSKQKLLDVPLLKQASDTLPHSLAALPDLPSLISNAKEEQKKKKKFANAPIHSKAPLSQAGRSKKDRKNGHSKKVSTRNSAAVSKAKRTPS